MHTHLAASSVLSHRARASQSSVIRELLKLTEQPGILSLAGGLPNVDLLPAGKIAEVAEAVLSASASSALQYSPTEGLGDLRSAVATRYQCDVGEVRITTGSQQGLDLIGRVCLDPGDVAVVEAPSYLGALQAFGACGAEIVAVEGDQDGLRTGSLGSQLAAGLRPKLVYVVSNFANPTGSTLSWERRVELATLADRYGFLIVEDDPYGEIRWSGEALAPMRTLTENCVTLGSASKILAPGLRVGWCIGPSWCLDAMTRLKQATDLHTSSLDQSILCGLLDDRVFVDGHVAKVIARYRGQAAIFSTALRELLGDQVSFADPQGGMFLWLTALDGSGSTRIFEAALSNRVAVVPGTAFGSGARCEQSVRVCFATLNEADLLTAAQRLAQAWPQSRP